jgi:hypothetical protein
MNRLATTITLLCLAAAAVGAEEENPLPFALPTPEEVEAALEKAWKTAAPLAEEAWTAGQETAADVADAAKDAAAEACAEHPEECAAAKGATADVLDGTADAVECAGDPQCRERALEEAKDWADGAADAFSGWLRRRANATRED